MVCNCDMMVVPIRVWLLLAVICGCAIPSSRATCVFESEFGVKLVCAVKKSGLFRIRNLGGLKAQVGLGFSIGDELGFEESLSNQENNRRRSAQSARYFPHGSKTSHNVAKMTNGTETGNYSDGNIPSFKPIPTANGSDIIPDISINEFAKRIIHNSPSNSSHSSRNEPLTSSRNNHTENIARNSLRLGDDYVSVRKPFQANSLKNSVGKVMNAPKEYYPIGYRHNFDDNFASRVELPTTSFECGNQKHFPGLYADVDFGCMVFHVCALTDEGLIMKSFLCPELTLFDQTILKCNWWFFVTCKQSKVLYDSNIPISKSYQLMKALSFFQDYKKGTSS